MKRKIKIVMFLGILSMFGYKGNTQESKPVRTKVPDWVCDEGYWVVTSNVTNSRNHSIFFYNNQHELIGRKDLAGVKLNLRRARTKRMLKHSLTESLLAWKNSTSSGWASESN